MTSPSKARPRYWRRRSDWVARRVLPVEQLEEALRVRDAIRVADDAGEPGNAKPQLIWAAQPDQFVFIDANLNTQQPRYAASGGVLIEKRK